MHVIGLRPGWVDAGPGQRDEVGRRKVVAANGGSSRAMRIALIAEGCYPFATGGVTTWADQLVHGLPWHEFEVVALTAGAPVEPVVPLPSNVVALTRVPLWPEPGPTDPRGVGTASAGAAGAGTAGAGTAGAEAAVAGAYARVLAATLDTEAPVGDFLIALRDLFDAAQLHGTPVPPPGRARQALRAAWPGPRPLTDADADLAGELIGPLLLPLAAPVVRADLCHLVSNGLTVLVALAARWTHGTPMILSEHGVYLRERYLGFAAVRYPWAVKAVLAALYRRLCAAGYAVAELIVPSGDVNRRWQRRLGADSARIVTVHNGVDPAAFPPAGDEPAVPTIGWVGRVDPLKDLVTLVEAFARVHRSRPEVVLRLFGPTPAGNAWYAERVRARVTRLRLDDAVRLEGAVPQVREAYRASTVVALSSVSEGLPYVVVEAMLSGRPTVCTDVGGITELVGDAGIVVPPGDPDALATALIHLLDDAALRADLAARGRRRAVERFGLDRMLAAFDVHYASVGRPVGVRT